MDSNTSHVSAVAEVLKLSERIAALERTVERMERRLARIEPKSTTSRALDALGLGS